MNREHTIAIIAAIIAQQEIQVSARDDINSGDFQLDLETEVLGVKGGRSGGVIDRLSGADETPTEFAQLAPPPRSETSAPESVVDQPRPASQTPLLIALMVGFSIGLGGGVWAWKRR